MSKHVKLPPPPKLTIGKFGYFMKDKKLVRAVIIGIQWHAETYQVNFERPHGWKRAKNVFKKRSELVARMLMQ